MSPPVLRPVTGVDGVTHLVTDEAMAAGRSRGRYVAVCDAPVLPASMTVQESSSCRRCRRRAGR